MSEVRAENTRYGFQFGAALVERTAEINGSVAVRITTDAGRVLTVYVSPKGQSVRVFRGGKELA